MSEQRYIFRWNRPGMPGRKGPHCYVTRFWKWLEVRGLLAAAAPESQPGLSEEQVMDAINIWRSTGGKLSDATAYLNQKLGAQRVSAGATSANKGGDAP